jgi:hypothetical protein
MSLTKIGSIGINTGIQFAGVTTVSTLHVGSGVTLSSDGDVFATGISTFSEDIKVGSGVTISPDGDGFYTGVVTATTFSGALAASNLTGTVPTARLGSGTASSSTFLRGDSTFAAVTSTTINSNADNRIITGSGTANTLNGESALTFDGNLLKLQVDSGEFRVEAANGVDAFSVDSDNGNTVIGNVGTLTIPDSIVHAGDTNTKIRFPAADTITAETGGSERLRIDSSGRLLLGTTSSRTVQGDSLLQIEDDTTSLLSIIRTSNNNGACFFTIGKTRNGAILQNNDVIGVLNFHGDDGTDLATPAAQIRVAVDGTPGGNDMPGRLEFLTTADGASSSTERLRITSDGRVLIGTATASGYTSRILTVAAADDDASIEIRTATDHAGQISFSDGSAGDATNYRGYIQYNHDGDYMRFGTSSTEYVRIASNGKVGINMTNPDDTLDVDGTFQVSSNAYISGTLYALGNDVRIGGTGTGNSLDDYEEGTFNPTFVTSSGSISMNTSYDALQYTKIGRMVHVMGQVVLSVSSPGGNLDMASLPFSFAQLTETSERGWALNVGYFNGSSPAGSNHFPFQVRLGEGAGTTTVRLQGVAPNDDGSIADWCGNGTDLWFNFWYLADT